MQADQEQLNQIQELIFGNIGRYVYVCVLFILVVSFKSSIIDAIAGLRFYLDRTFNEDDVVFLDGRVARITKIGFRRSRFYMADKNSVLTIENSRLNSHVLEKSLLKGTSLGKIKEV